MNFTDTSSHHARLFTSHNRKGLAKDIWAQLQEQSVANTLYDQTVIDIATARNLITWANTPYHEMKIALISFHSMTLEAQNALLKVFEEPSPRVAFILVAAHKDSLLPTLLSRLEYMHHESADHESPKEETEGVHQFLQEKPSTRMKLACIVTLLSEVDEEGRKNREKVKEFILTLAEVLRTQNAKPSLILEVLSVASFAGDPSSSGKTLLEYLSLLLPVTNAK